MEASDQLRVSAGLPLLIELGRSRGGLDGVAKRRASAGTGIRVSQAVGNHFTVLTALNSTSQSSVSKCIMQD
jgi:hypothetical protein